MPLVKMSQVLKPALEGKYAVGAFNADNLEMVQAFIEAAEKEHSPLILQLSQGAINYAGLAYVVSLVQTAARQTAVPIVLHLDHGKDLEQNVLALRAGVTCLGVDASMLSFEDNLAVTQQVCQLAHFAGLEAEAGVGYVPDSADKPMPKEVEEAKTDPAQAEEFVTRTGADLLAVALGSMRGMRRRVITLDIERLKAIHERTRIPLVLHGASGLRWESIHEAIQHGICKVNMAACFDRCLTNTLRQKLSELPDEINFRKIIGPAHEAVKEEARKQIRLLGSSGRA